MQLYVACGLMVVSCWYYSPFMLRPPAPLFSRLGLARFLESSPSGDISVVGERRRGREEKQEEIFVRIRRGKMERPSLPASLGIKSHFCVCRVGGGKSKSFFSMLVSPTTFSKQGKVIRGGRTNERTNKKGVRGKRAEAAT